MSSGPRDAVVVGGGIVGAHCGLQLAEAGLDDVLILERDAPASAASSRAAGHLTIYGHERFGAEPSRLGRELYDSLEAEHDPLTFHRETSYTLAYTDQGAEYLREHEGGGGVLESELVRVEAFAEEHPEFAVDDVTAVSRDGESVYTDPQELTLAVHAAAREAGAELRLEAVTDIEPDGGGLAVETTDDQYEAPVVVVAAGAWTKQLLQRAGTDVALQPRTSQIAILDPAEPMDVPIWSAPDYSIYGRPTTDGRLLFGGGVATPVADLEGFRNRALVPFLGEVAEFAPYVFPALERANLHDDRAGRVSATPDRYPHIGETDVEGLYVCGGFNGEGISNGPFGGRLLADLVVGREPVVDPEPFDPRRYDGDETFRIGNAVEWWADR